MKILNQPLKRTIVAASLVFTLFLASCEDHRVPPTEQALPDRIFYALSDNNQLHEINIRNTSSPVRSFAITGLQDNEVLAGIDFRPATGQLYAIGSLSNLYQVNIKTGDQEGKATRIGMNPIATILNGSSIGFDFNPTVDKIRVVSNTAQNLRLNPETGAVLAGDSPLNGPASPKVGAVAYTNSRAGVTAAPGVGTTLYDIDPEADMLYIQSPPNPGTLVPVGALGLDISEVGGFDISPDMNPADVYPIASVKFGGKWELDFVDLKTGKLQKLGDLPAGVNITGIAIPAMPVAYALDGANNLKIFNPADGSEYGTKAIGGLPGGVMLEGIDIRPANGRLYALGNDSKLYSVDLGSGAAMEAAVLKKMDNSPLMLDGTYFGVDFNPAADRLRVVSDKGQNLRIDVATGITTKDTALKIGMDTPFVTAVAYTNSYPGVVAANTTLFDIDSQSNMLYKQIPPNNGTLADGKALGIDVATGIGFDIGNFTGKGYAIFTVGGTTSFYTIDLASGNTQLKYSFSTPVKGLATGFGL
ncbi:DUF4394 domain-containing protein [Dyadobacter aurulentus]|uniref:DUF4394 domain-containing protein n=1 Tax=Dyadobacter sp. UC 10 TaxID=2605428 RepID=UPI0011F2AC6F|nr:DUF4394 domain-containing protein [Dyadobacter sp. UC 10]KAA0991924.1 DUF4394 domain-containing protein [Dyadobacter sp. UC 10]